MFFRTVKGKIMEKKKLGGKFWLALTIFSLMGQVAWVIENMYLNVFIYEKFSASSDDIASMVAASAITATLTTVFMGALSDRIGKRRLLICGGYILWGISIFSFVLVDQFVSAAVLGVSFTILLDCLMTFFGSTASSIRGNIFCCGTNDRD